jgi:hypothetical protein
MLVGASFAWALSARDAGATPTMHGGLSARSKLHPSPGALLDLVDPEPVAPASGSGSGSASASASGSGSGSASASRSASRHAPARPAVAILVEDEAPPPPPREPLLWDDIFPGAGPSAKSSGKASPGCFDQLQGVRGLSPCPDTTPR